MIPETPRRQVFFSVFILLLFAACGSGTTGSAESAAAAATGSTDSVAAADTLRILAYNIHHGEGMDEELDLGRIARLILEADPDLVALQEVDSVVARTDGVDQAAELGRLTGMRPVFGRFMAYQGGAYGMARGREGR